MGKLINGVWHDVWYPSRDGRFHRSSPRFRDQVSADGSTGFPAVRGRYHLYVSPACPWSHRCLIFRVLKRLEDIVSVTMLEPLMLEHGWTFGPERPDPIAGHDHLYQVYLAARPDYTGRVTVPVLWDRERATIVSNESSEIIRMFNRAFATLAEDSPDYYPEPLRREIDALNERIYRTVNNGVYRAGFATTQEAYEEAVIALFDSLDWLEVTLDGRPCLLGDTPTEADWRLFPTLLRFDAVYHYHFKCNVRRLVDYPRLFEFTRRLAAVRGIRATIDMDHIRRHYYGSHRSINPTGIVPVGPSHIEALLPDN